MEEVDRILVENFQTMIIDFQKFFSENSSIEKNLKEEYLIKFSNKLYQILNSHFENELEICKQKGELNKSFSYLKEMRDIWKLFEVIYMEKKNQKGKQIIDILKPIYNQEIKMKINENNDYKTMKTVLRNRLAHPNIINKQNGNYSLWFGEMVNNLIF